MPLFVFGGVINILMIMTLMVEHKFLSKDLNFAVLQIWPLNPGDRALFNAIAGVWGMADGVWNTQLNGNDFHVYNTRSLYISARPLSLIDRFSLPLKFSVSFSNFHFARIGLWVALLGRTSLELAFANYRFWMSFGMAFGFFLIRFTNIYQFLLVAFAFLLVGILGYFIVELYDMFVVSRTPPTYGGSSQ